MYDKCTYTENDEFCCDDCLCPNMRLLCPQYVDDSDEWNADAATLLNPQRCDSDCNEDSLGEYFNI